MIGFRKFFEEEGEGNKFVSTIKKQLHVPKALWLGMPIVMSNAKIGGHMIHQPTTFFVTDFNDEEVTIRSVGFPGYGEDGTDDSDDDIDGEIDMDRGDLNAGKEFIITREAFYKLLQPDASSSLAGSPMGGMF